VGSADIDGWYANIQRTEEAYLGGLRENLKRVFLTAKLEEKVVKREAVESQISRRDPTEKRLFSASDRLMHWPRGLILGESRLIRSL
jgi:hypothetical protein